MKKYILVGFIAITLTFMAGVFALWLEKPSVVQGSVDFEFAGYYSTTTREVTGAILTNLSRIKNGSGVFGSIVVTGANTGMINIYDATTTNKNLRTKTATTTLVSIPASMAAGTYTFDIIFNNGLIYEYSGLAPTSTITWK